MTDHYAVIGHPVAHSKSPQIHAEFARHTGQNIDYAALLAPLEGFAATAQEFFAAGGLGLNVTLPFKRDAWELVTVRHGDAVEAESVNTIKREGGRLEGYITDGIGLITDLETNLQFRVGGKRVLLMGAGGASYGVMPTLLRQAPQVLVVANRTPDKAARLVAHFQKSGQLTRAGLSARSYDRLAGSAFDLVINATSASLTGQMPPLPEGLFAPDALAYDMVYGQPTPFLQYAAARGARVADGFGMLVEQAAESFWIWRGVRPQTAAVIARLRGSP